MIAQTILVLLIIYLFVEVTRAHTGREAEADRIDIHLQRPIDHALQMKERVGYMAMWYGLSASITVVADIFFDIHLFITLAATAGMVWSMWTVQFRQNLNIERQLSWYYMGLDAKYDRFWMKLFLKQSKVNKDVGHTWLQYAEMMRKSYVIKYDKAMKKAGTAAYSFEAFILLCSTGAFIYTIFKPGQ